MPSVSSGGSKKFEHVLADEQGKAFNRPPIQRGWMSSTYTARHPRNRGLQSGYPFQSFALLLRLYTPRNPSLGGNRLGMVPR